jgi:hypothetical protein
LYFLSALSMFSQSFESMISIAIIPPQVFFLGLQR